MVWKDKKGKINSQELPFAEELRFSTTAEPLGITLAVRHLVEAGPPPTPPASKPRERARSGLRVEFAQYATDEGRTRARIVQEDEAIGRDQSRASSR